MNNGTRTSAPVSTVAGFKVLMSPLIRTLYKWQLNFCRHVGEKNRIGRCIRNNVYNFSLFHEINAVDQVFVDDHVIECLLVHEMIMLAFRIS